MEPAYQPARLGLCTHKHARRNNKNNLAAQLGTTYILENILFFYMKRVRVHSTGIYCVLQMFGSRGPADTGLILHSMGFTIIGTRFK